MSELFLSEEQARRLWERAAQLQAEATQKQEDPEEEVGEGEGNRRRLITGVEEEGDGYSLAHIKQAGLEVGIQSDFLDLALAEEAILELEGGGRSGYGDRLAEWFLKDGQRSLEIRRRFEFPSRLVWLAVEETLTSDAHDLELLEVRAGEPAHGGISIFESPYTYERSGSLKYWSTVAEVRRYLVQVIPEGDEECTVVIRAPLRRAKRVNGVVGGAFAGAGGLLGGGAGIGIASLLLVPGAPVALPVGLSLMALGVVGGERLTRAGYVKMYRWGFRALEKALKKTLSRIERDLRREREARLPPG